MDGRLIFRHRSGAVLKARGDAVRSRERAQWTWCVPGIGLWGRQIRPAQGSAPGEVEGQPEAIPCRQTAQKSPVTQVPERPYRNPPLVGTPLAEKVYEITPVKELGNLTP